MPGEIEINAGRAHPRGPGREYRRPADPGRLALSFLRDQFEPAVRSRTRPAAFAWTFRREPRCASSRARGAPCGWCEYGGLRRVVRLSGQGHGGPLGWPLKISRQAYAEMFGPTVGDRVRLADTALIVEVEQDFTVYGEEVKFGGGKVIRDGMGQGQGAQRRGRRHRDHQRAHHRSLGHRQSRRGTEGRRHLGHRQGRKSRRPAAGHHSDRRGDRDHRRRGHDPDRRRHRHAHSFHLPAADRGGADIGRHHDDRRRHRTRGRHQRHHLHAGAVAHSQHAARGRGASR